MVRTSKVPPSTAADAEHAFYDAIEHCDLDAAMALWSDDDEIIFHQPGTARAVGHAPVRAALKALLAQGPIQIHVSAVHEVAHPGFCVRSLLQQVIANVEGRPHRTDRHVTNVFLSTAQGWRLISHHASPVPPHDDATHRSDSILFH